MIAAVTDLAAEGLALSCHDISEGGLGVAVAEMLLLAAPDRPAGARVTLPTTGRADAARFLFCETGGYVVEVAPARERAARAVLTRRGVRFARIGETTSSGSLAMAGVGGTDVVVSLADLERAWTRGATEVLL
jgi:phosphoribosylformylglycinamidine synthase